MAQKQIDPVEDMHKRINFFLTKKKLNHIHDSVIDNLAKLELAMEKNGVSFDNLRSGIAPDEVLNQWERLNKSKIREQGIIAHEFQKAVQAGELGEKFEEEYQHWDGQTQLAEERKVKVEEAKQRFQDNPRDEEARKEYIKSVVFGDKKSEQLEEEREKPAKEMLNNAINTLRKKTIESAVEERKHFGKHKIYDSEGRELGEYNPVTCNQYAQEFEKQVQAAAQEG